MRNDSGNLEILELALKNDIITPSDMEKLKNSMKRKSFKKLKNTLKPLHPYTIAQTGKDNRWRTYVADESCKSGRRLIVKTSEESLYKALADHYGLDWYDEEDQVTLENFYPKWLSYKALHTNSETYINRIDSDWKSYYLGTPIIRKPLKRLNKLVLDVWAHELIKTHSMTKTQYYNSTVIIRQALGYAVDLGLISENPFKQVMIDGKRMFRKVKKKPDATQVYQTDEELAVSEMAWKDYHDHNRRYDLAPLAVLFSFQTGLRIGELCAVRYEDIENPDYIHIQRMYNKDLKKVIEHTKTDYGDRQVILTQKAKQIIATARKRQEEVGAATTGYIFSLNGTPLPQHAIAYLFRKYCKASGTMVKSSHKVRKTYISALLDAHVNINTVRELVGHADERTTLKNYCFDRNTEEEKRKKVEQALI